ncbi:MULTISPECIES: DUF5953 family protein [Corallococcus]|uniref:DUF5953 family protein n=1 Tax=Corallococcus TaxID=83461 RepID=UPI002D1E366C|nr:DUF5953 family protein [Corallococcus sp. BB11-1]
MERDGRPTAIIHAMEHALPGLRLEWRIAEDGAFIPLTQRDAWFATSLSAGVLALLCNADEGHLVTLFGMEMPASEAPGGRAQLEAHAELPLDAATTVAAAAVLEAIAEAAFSFWGHATPTRAASEISEQTSPTMAGPPSPPRGLPTLKPSWEIRSPEIPHHLGWLNYWSAATARILGFPEPSRDTGLLTRSRRTSTGGWIVQLTEAPLDLDNPSHLDALLRAYERFPEIGGRVP